MIDYVIFEEYEEYPPPKFKSSPLNKWCLEDGCLPYWGPVTLTGSVTFQGRAVKLREGMW